jgi:hypothetical protein
MELPLLAASSWQGVVPPDILIGETKMVLQDASEQVLAANADLAINACHTTCRLVGRVHKGIIKPQPIIEWVLSIYPLKLVKSVSSLGAMAELRLVFGADLDIRREDRQVMVVIRLVHSIGPLGSRDHDPH